MLLEKIPQFRAHRKNRKSKAAPAPPESIWSVASVVIDEGENFAAVTLAGSIDLTTLSSQTLARLGRCFGLQFINAPQAGVVLGVDGPRVMRLAAWGVSGVTHGPWYLEEDAWGTLAALGMRSPIGGRCGPLFPFPSSFHLYTANVKGLWTDGPGPTIEDTGSSVYPPAQVRVDGVWYDCDSFDPDGPAPSAFFGYDFPTPGFPDAIRLVTPAGALQAIPVEAGEAALVPLVMNPGDVRVVSIHDNGDATIDITFDAPFTTAGGGSYLRVYAMQDGQGTPWWTFITFPGGSAQTSYTCGLDEGFISPVSGWLIGDTFAINGGEQTIRGPQRGMAQ